MDDTAEIPRVNNVQNIIQAPGPQIVKIDPDGRYIFLFASRLPDAEISHIQTTLGEWWENGTQFLVVSGDVTLERLEGDA